MFRDSLRPLPAYLLPIQEKYKLDIIYLGKRQFYVSTQEGSSLENILPGSVARAQQAKSNPAHFDQETLQRLVSFLNQPFRYEADRHAQENGKDLSRKERRRESFERRKDFHRFMRLAVCGAQEIPEYTDHEIEKAKAAGHSHFDGRMKEELLWDFEPEIGNNADVLSSIPGSGYDPEHGFFFNLNEEFLTDIQTQGNAQKTAKSLFWMALEQSTGKNYQQEKPKLIYLKPPELEKFCEIIQEPEHNLNNLMKVVEHEENFAKAIKCIEAEINGRTGSVEGACKIDPSDRMTAALMASTALKPYVTEESLKKAWSVFHFSDRDKPPFDEIRKELDVLQAVLEYYSAQGTVTQAQMDAITSRFYAVFEFGKEFCDILAAGPKNKSKFLSLGRYDNALSENAITIQSAFEVASASEMKVSERFMDEKYREALDTLRNVWGYKRGALKTLIKKTWDNAVEISKDASGFLFDSPKTASIFAVATVSLFTTRLLYNNWDWFMETSGIRPPLHLDQKVANINDDGTVDFQYDDNVAIVEYKRPKFHWDPGFSRDLLVRHYPGFGWMHRTASYGLDAAENTLHNFLNQAGVEFPVGYKTSFSAGAHAGIDGTMPICAGVNVLQDGSHIFMWYASGSNTSKRGVAGFTAAMDFLNPIKDLLYQTGKRLRKKWRQEQASNVHARLLAIAENSPLNTQVAISNEDKLKPTQINSANWSPELETDIDLKLAGLKHQFHLSADNYPAILNSLEEFRKTILYRAEQLGISSETYRNNLEQNINEALQAFSDYGVNCNKIPLEEKLEQNLGSIISAELRYLNGVSPVLEAFGEVSDPEKAKTRQVALHIGGIQDSWVSKMEDSKARSCEKVAETSSSWERKKAITKYKAALIAGWLVDHSRKLTDRVTRIYDNSDQRVIASLPVEKRHIYKGLATLAGGTIALCVGADSIAAGNTLTNGISYYTGVAAGSGGSAGVVYPIGNIPQDIIFAHGGGIVFCSLVGCGIHYSLKTGRYLLKTSLEDVAYDLKKGTKDLGTATIAGARWTKANAGPLLSQAWAKVSSYNWRKKNLPESSDVVSSIASAPEPD